MSAVAAQEMPVNPKLLPLRVIDHPYRQIILNKLWARTASPSELTEEITGASLGVVSYHVRALYLAGLLRLVRKAPRRGAVEHYYRANAQRVDALRDRLEWIGKFIEGGD